MIFAAFMIFPAPIILICFWGSVWPHLSLFGRLWGATWGLLGILWAAFGVTWIHFFRSGRHLDGQVT